MSTYTLPSPAFNWKSLGQRTPGYSEQASATEYRTTKLERHLLENEYASNPKKRFLEGLFTILEECLTTNWDCYGAAPISKQSILNAITFYSKKLSADVPFPEISPEPDGEVALEWSGKHGVSFSMSFSSSNYVSFASVLTGRRIRGSSEASKINVKVIKELILESIQG